MTEMYPRQSPVGPPPGQPSRRRTVALLIGVLLVAAAVGVGLGQVVNANRAHHARDHKLGATTSAPVATKPAALKPATAAGRVKPGLVDINTVLGGQGGEAAGTGMVLTPSGDVLTNNHVVAGATSIRVTDVGNGKIYRAKVLGYDRSGDIAVLRMSNASGLSTVPIGDSDSVGVGDRVLGIGNAGGKGGAPSVAAGRVTTMERTITATDESGNSSEQLTGLIEVDADIKPGDSGGALVNSAGQVVGMDTAASSHYRLSAKENGPSQGFAIPIDRALPVARQIIAGTASSTVHIGRSAFLGISVSDARQAGFGAGGAEIVGVVDGSAADDAGLATGDVITSVNGADLASASALTALMDTHHPGDKLTVGYSDPSGGHHTVTVVPDDGPVG